MLVLVGNFILVPALVGQLAWTVGGAVVGGVTGEASLSTLDDSQE